MPLAGQIIRAQDFAGHATVSNTTSQSVSGTSFSAGASVCGTSFVAPTSGIVTILWGGQLKSGSSTPSVDLSIEVRTGSTIGSGTVVSSATQSSSVSVIQANQWFNVSNFRTVTGLTPGASYNVRTMHRMTGSGSGTVENRNITVLPGI